jgi:hypothetical protein
MAGMPQKRMINATEQASMVGTSLMLTKQLQNWLSIYTTV